MKHPQAIQHWEELWGLSHLLAQHPRLGVGGSHFRGRPALASHQRSAQGEVQPEFMLYALRGVWQRLEQSQSLAEVANRLPVGTSPGRILCRLLQIRYGPAVIPPALKVHSQFGCDLARPFPISLRFPLADPPM